ncbi:MAG: AI-2E family transporter [Thermoanaerobaculales bacterium]|jgi:predicted PurR-regulated permease PerM|nr:AI-2E family transporter [Thermoanaerobaculales bacterium]
MGDSSRPRLGARFLMVGAAVVVVLAGLKAAQSLVIPFLLALFLAIICFPAVAWLTARRVPVGLAVIAVVIVLLAAFSGFGAIVGGSVDDFTAFATQNQARFDGLVKSASTWLEAREIDPESLDLLNMLQPGKLINLLGGVLKNLAAVLSNFFLIMLTMIFMLFEAASIPVKIRAAVGKGQFDIDNIRHAVIQVQHYLGLKTVTSLTTGILVGLWTAILGLDFAVVWGLLAFLLNYIPSIGSIVAAVPAVLLGLVQGGIGYAILVAVGYVVTNIGIGNFVEPWLMGRTLGLSTLVVFLSLVFWGWMWGSVGMLLSVPLTMIIKILLENTDDLQWISVMLDNRRGAEKRLEAAEATD